MKWVEVKIYTGGRDMEIAAAGLLDFGIESVEIIDPAENARYIAENPHNWDYIDESLAKEDENAPCFLRFFVTKEEAAAVLPQISAAFDGFVANEVEDDWSHAWLEHYKPFVIGKNIAVVPVWEEYEARPGQIVFKIDPGHVFGTGQHQSTALCAAILERYAAPGNKLLDIGTGSGILAIIGALLGASDITAVDTDPAALRVCLENAGHNGNGIAAIKTLEGNLLTNTALRAELGGGYNCITANIIADVIIPMTPIIAEMLAPGGIFIAGGIIKNRRDEVKAALTAAGLAVFDIKTQDEWVAIAAGRK